MQDDTLVSTIYEIISYPKNNEKFFSPKITIEAQYSHQTEINALCCKKDVNTYYGSGHTAFMRKDCKNKIFFISDSNNCEQPHFDDYIENEDACKVLKDGCLLVSIGTELSSSMGGCMFNAFYNSIFFTKNNYLFSNSLANFIKDKKQNIPTLSIYKKNFQRECIQLLIEKMVFFI